MLFSWRTDKVEIFCTCFNTDIAFDIDFRHSNIFQKGCRISYKYLSDFKFGCVERGSGTKSDWSTGTE